MSDKNAQHYDKYRPEAKQALSGFVAFMADAFSRADHYRGQHASAYWRAIRRQAQDELEQVELAVADLDIFDERGLENLRDAIERSTRGLRVHRKQFARVQWAGKASRELLHRLQDRRLVRTWGKRGADPQGSGAPAYIPEAQSVKPRPDRGFNMAA